MIFEEKQKINLWWLYVVFGIQAIIILSITFSGKIGTSISELKQIYFTPIVVVIFIFILAYFINQNHLLLTISNQSITCKNWPLFSKRTILWTDIESAYLGKYDALGEYGGWGFRYRLWFKWKDKAFIFNNGPKGLQIVLKNGRKLLFSAAKIDELSIFLELLKQKHDLLTINTDAR